MYQIAKKTIIENTNLYLIFDLSAKTYAIEANTVVEITAFVELKVPEKLASHVAGVINFKGKTINVFDLKPLLGIKKTNYTTEHQILIIKEGENLLGLVIDKVEDIMNFEQSNFEKTSYAGEQNVIKSIYKRDDKLIAILGVAGLIDKLESSKIVIDTELLMPADEQSQKILKQRALNLQKVPNYELVKHQKEDKFISFSLNNEFYCINIKNVREFCKLNAIHLTKIPCNYDFILGIANLRGDFITIIDIKKFLNIKPTAITDKTKMIVLNDEGVKIGFLVDDIQNMINISAENLSAIFKNAEPNKFTMGELILNGNKVMNIFNPDRLLTDERMFIEES